MFGYVKAFAPELKVKDYTLYKATYCGLCKTMGKCTGNCSRLTLSYDMVFLALVRMALLGVPYATEKKRCVVHPFAKRVMMKPNDALTYAANAAALLSYAKLDDDVNDTRGVKKLGFLLAKPAFAYAKHRAGCAELYTQLKNELDTLDALEKDQTASVDLPAECFARLCGILFSHDLDGTRQKIAYAVGFHTGKWIYAADALDDIEKDRKSGSYNPFILLYGDITAERAKTIAASLFDNLTSVEKALDLVTFPDESVKNVVYNILYEGMRRKGEELCERLKENIIE